MQILLQGQPSCCFQGRQSWVHWYGSRSDSPDGIWELRKARPFSAGEKPRWEVLDLSHQGRGLVWNDFSRCNGSIGKGGENAYAQWPFLPARCHGVGQSVLV